jgi:hypothetical protein
MVFKLFTQKEMEKFVRFIVQKLKDAELFASQGGPIILTQVFYFSIYSCYFLNLVIGTIFA